MSNSSKSVVPLDEYLDNINNSLDLSEDDNVLCQPWESLLYYLKIHHLEKLCQVFKKEADTFIESPETTTRLTKEQFVNVIDNILGHSKYSLQALSLFNEIPHPDEKKITWNQFLDYYIEHAIPKELVNIRLAETEVFEVPHVKRETIVKIVLLETETSFCYAIVSKYGKVGLYDGHLNILTTYQVIFTRSDKLVNSKVRQRRTVWVTDAIYLANVRIFVVSSSARTITFYDAAGQKHKALWLLEGTPNVFQCMAYHSDLASELFLGDEYGSIVIMKFLQPQNTLLRKKYSDRLSTYYWRELSVEPSYVNIKTYVKIHSNRVRQMIYYPESYTLVSCSRDHKKSIVLFHLKERKRSYVFGIGQGTSCFSLSHTLHMVVSGNESGAVHVWNLFVPARAVATLVSHGAAIADVQILSRRDAAATCSRDGLLKVWDLKAHTCLQTIHLSFPSFGILGKCIEWGTSSIYPGPKTSSEIRKNTEISEDDGISTVSDASSLHPANISDTDPWDRTSILISCCNYIAKLSTSYGNKTNCQDSVLPPPPIQNNVIVPETWKIGEHEVSCIEKVDLELHIDEKLQLLLKDTIERDFLTKMGSRHDMNYRIAAMESKKAEMQKAVRQCAPYIALDLHEVDEVQLAPHLPIPNCKRTQQIADRTHRLLSAASTRSGILSDRSSKSRSSRSSVIEFYLT